MMFLFAGFVVGLAIVLCLLHTRAVGSALSEMRLLRLLSHNRLSAITSTVSVIMLMLNMWNPMPLVTGIVFIPIAAMWLLRTINAVQESREKTGKTNLKYTYQKMFNDAGQEIDAEAIEAFIDGRMEDLNDQIDEAENSISDEQRRLIQEAYDTDEQESTPTPEQVGEEEDGDGSESDQGVEGEPRPQPRRDTDSSDISPMDDIYAFNPGDTVKITNVPTNKAFPQSLIGQTGQIGLRLPNIRLVHNDLNGHGYHVNGYTLPEECLQKV